MISAVPEDENGDVLRRMAADGDDSSKTREIDFSVVFADGERAEIFANHFRGLGYTASVEHSGTVGEMPWDVVVKKHMLPAHADITLFEQELQEKATVLGGRNDGWGCFIQPRVD